METKLLGIHHVTAIASEPQRNIDFYAGVLGLRLVKVTINYDDPGSYHFYYGDGVGSPGTILTFFAWPNGYRGERGTGQVTVTGFSVPEGALAYWQERFKAKNVSFEASTRRFDTEEALTFYDPDGLKLELVAHSGTNANRAWAGGPIPSEQALRGFHNVTLAEERLDRTASLLTETMGFRQIGREGDRTRYEAGTGEDAQKVDVLNAPGGARGRVAVGTVHHVAWRAANDAEQAAWHQRISGLGYSISPVMDRQYFHSIYYREPGGVLFEIATDPPGFTADESIEALGTSLRLPEWLEPDRVQIERLLPPIRRPQPEEG